MRNLPDTREIHRVRELTRKNGGSVAFPLFLAKPAVGIGTNVALQTQPAIAKTR